MIPKLIEDKTQEAKVFNHLVQHGPKTRQQLADETGLPLQSVCARVGSLDRSGKIKSCGYVTGAFGKLNSLIRAVMGEKQNPQTDLFA